MRSTPPEHAGHPPEHAGHLLGHQLAQLTQQRVDCPSCGVMANTPGVPKHLLGHRLSQCLDLCACGD